MATHAYGPEDDPIPFFPNHFLTEFKVALGMLAVAAVIAVLPMFHMEIGPPADPLNTPEHIKPEWYFLAIYQVLKYVPKSIGTFLPLALIGLLFVWPFLDRRPDTDGAQSRRRRVVVAVALVAFVALTIWGAQ